MQQIIRRKNLDHKHIAKLKYQDNYKASGVFKSKSLAYCFYFIPRFNLGRDMYGGDLSAFSPLHLEDLLMSQVSPNRRFSPTRTSGDTATFGPT